MAEPVRLVIWDLDETFWEGTLTEGGMIHDSHSGQIVKELARRGIMSSICSKNDFEPTAELLRKLGVWDCFIFPSISWEPKGKRIQAIIEAVKLRPETVMFIDDNAMNIEEAKYFCPNIQTATEHFVPEILDSPLFKGKDDSGLTRLANYKLLEKKQNAKACVGGDVQQFLRESGISVEINHDVEGNIDRIVELINRTNQLNFTKIRLSDDPEAARVQVREMTADYNIHTGLVHVRDRYGDYGLVGFFVRRKGAGYNELLHYCFSCRTLGMFVETWFYRELERPQIKVSGEVLSDLHDESQVIDWISYYVGDNTDQNVSPDLGGILLCGGCDLEAVAHYLQRVTPDLQLFSNIIRHGAEIRRDHTTILTRSIDRPEEDDKYFLENLGYADDDYNLDFARKGRKIIVFSFWTDLYYQLYEHQGFGRIAPFAPSNLGHTDINNFYEVELRNRGVPDEGIVDFRYARANVKCIGCSGEKLFRANVEKLFSVIPPETKILVIGASENPLGVQPDTIEQHRKFNSWITDICTHLKNAHVLPVDMFVENPFEQQSSTHFQRLVYQRLAKKITEIYRALD